MSSTDAATGNGRRGKSSKSEAVVDNAADNAVDNTVDNAVALEEDMTDKEQSSANGNDTKSAAKAGGLQLSKKNDAEANGQEKSQKGALQLQTAGSTRPVAPGAIEVADTMMVSGLRPIASSQMEIYGTILNNRPVMASSLRVIDTDTIPGHRPIFASDLRILDDMELPGGRPIVASDPKLLEASLLPGGRPIAPNETEEGELLMGYLD